MSTLAIIPLTLLRDSLALQGKRAFDANLVQRFGYMRSQRMTPAVVYSTPDLSYVRCGNLPLVAHVGIKFSLRYSQQRGCYINTAGNLVWPG